MNKAGFIIILLLSACCSNTPKLIHESMPKQNYINYIKLANEEKACLSDSAVEKIFMNKERCDSRIDSINDIIQSHNKAHGEK